VFGRGSNGSKTLEADVQKTLRVLLSLVEFVAEAIEFPVRFNGIRARSETIVCVRASTRVWM
jgi:hypothetical protein